MNKIDISGWKEFSIVPLFSVERPNSRTVKNYEEGDTPFVSSGNFNNGVDSYRKPLENEKLDKGNCITVSPVDASTFYQEVDFLGRGGGGSSIILLYNDNLNKMNGLFLASVIRKTLKRLYEYNDMGSSESIKKEKIKLPVTKDGNPDWEYMESFIKRLYSRERESTSNVSSYLEKSELTRIDTKKWKRFHLYDDSLFEVFAGTKLDKKNMTSINPNINFIGRSNLNNGVSEEVDYITNIEPYKKGDITLALGGHYLGSCFIQNKPFYTSQNVNVLRAKKDISFNCKLFITTMIFKESQTYYKAFEDELNRHIMTDFSILLPIDKDEKPDWNFMDNLIGNIKSECINKLQVM
ncbi:restriction endonuclease subunit S [Treponema pedis]|uniref:Restriction endonuclease subunit S n=1 Tax=Treponema pedis TaxID=409322 RepID=A0A7S7AWS6_9SPIR|nr:restriction endonuclease subunit S [Treponema pedis]QOW61039.1 restriction endonuclease subunit S [Treponema pedis]